MGRVMGVRNRIDTRLKALSANEGRKVTKSDLARSLGIDPQNVTNWGGRNSIPRKYIFDVAVFLECRPEWLSTGEGPETESGVAENVLPYSKQDYEVPVISWVTAGEWMEVYDNFEPGDAEMYLPCPSRHGPHTYGLRVQGDSMTAPHGRSYPGGAIIYVDPDQSGGVVTGDRVIAKINGENGVTFKCFVDDGGRRFLKALNPQYPIITDEFRVIGKVIGMYIPE